MQRHKKDFSGNYRDYFCKQEMPCEPKMDHNNSCRSEDSLSSREIDQNNLSTQLFFSRRDISFHPSLKEVLCQSYLNYCSEIENCHSSAESLPSLSYEELINYNQHLHTVFSRNRCLGD